MVILEIIGIAQPFQANTFIFVSLGIFQSNTACMKLLTITRTYSSGSYSFLQVSELRARRLYFTFVNRTLLGEENVAAASDRFEIIVFQSDIHTVQALYELVPTTLTTYVRTYFAIRYNDVFVLYHSIKKYFQSDKRLLRIFLSAIWIRYCYLFIYLFIYLLLLVRC